jgi:FlaA1/EpsC-like NDP-sugar epimerase
MPRGKSWWPDLALTALAWPGAFWLRFNFDLYPPYDALMLKTGPLAVLCMALALALMRVQRQSWRYVGLADLRRLAAAVALGTLLTTALVLGLRLEGFPRSVFLISGVLTLVFLAGARAAWRTLSERAHAQGLPRAGQKRLLVLGAMQEADQALRTLKGMTGWCAAGVVSPSVADTGRTLQGLPVWGGVEALAEVAARQVIDTVLLASPPGAPLRREALMRWSGSALNLLTLPAPDEWLQGGGAMPRQVRLEDLLGRAPVQLDAQGLSALFAGQTVLVTGAGGSIGSELCRQVARFGVQRLVCVDQSEYATYQLERQLRKLHPALTCSFYTASVREPQRLEAIARAHAPGVVLHAAAYKHVPLMEEANAIEALRTNVLGTLNAARVAGQAGAARFVLISTDKAVNPTNVMGASKRMAEQVVQSLAQQYPDTRFVAVRFGNVLGSSGSVAPLFAEQVARGGPVTVTHPDIVRYFMTIPEAAQLVLQAGLMGQSGQVFVLDMGEPVKIVELAQMMIRLSGKSEADVPIVFTGLRPGEKLYEELLADNETTDATPHPKLRVARTPAVCAQLAPMAQAWIERAGAAPEAAQVRAWLQQNVPEYRPDQAQMPARASQSPITSSRINGLSSASN